MTTIYLSGPIQYAQDDGRGWRARAVAEYGDEFDFIDPVENLVYEEEDVTPEQLTRSDKADIDDADVVLIGMHQTIQRRYPDGLVEEILMPSYGTGREHEYAMQTDTPIVVWTSDVIEQPVWMESDANIIEYDLDSCMGWIRRIYA